MLEIKYSWGKNGQVIKNIAKTCDSLGVLNYFSIKQAVIFACQCRDISTEDSCVSGKVFHCKILI